MAFITWGFPLISKIESTQTRFDQHIPHILNIRRERSASFNLSNVLFRVINWARICRRKRGLLQLDLFSRCC